MFIYFVGPVIFWPSLQFCLASILLVMAFTQSSDFGYVSIYLVWSCDFGHSFIVSCVILAMLRVVSFLALQSWS